MRISDWSSDVCSSDLALGHGGVTRRQRCARLADALGQRALARREALDAGDDRRAIPVDELEGDRKSVVMCKSGSVRVDLGGRSVVTKKTIRYMHRAIGITAFNIVTPIV